MRYQRTRGGYSTTVARNLAINVASPLSITTPNFEYLTISCDSYTKEETRTKISEVVGAAPALLNTLVELSAALGDDHNYATTINTALTAKAPLNNAALTGLTTVADLKVAAGVSTDNPAGLVLGGSSVSTLGDLTVNGDALILGASTNHAHSITNSQLGGASSVFLEAKVGRTSVRKGRFPVVGAGVCEYGRTPNTLSSSPHTTMLLAANLLLSNQACKY